MSNAHSAVLLVTCTLRAPILTRASGAGAYGIDTPIARNPANQPIIPGSLLKGRLRQAFRDIGDFTGNCTQARQNDLFGAVNDQNLVAPSGEEFTPSDNSPRRGRLYFQDLVHADDLPETSAATETTDAPFLTRIAIDDDAGRVKDSAYQLIESPWPVGTEVSFTGTIRLLHESKEHLEKAAADITKALHWIDQLGGNRGTGFGRVTNWATELALTASPAITVLPAEADASLITVELYPQSPFCIALPRTCNNVYESDTEIPGNVIKGCLAQTLFTTSGPSKNNTSVADLPGDRWPNLKKHFDTLIVRHGFPSARETTPPRPVRPPLSLIFCPKPRELPDNVQNPTAPATGDMFADACELDGPPRTGPAPNFAIDWKYPLHRRVQKAYGWANPAKTLRVRTAIDPKTRRAMDEQLFAQSLVCPTGADGQDIAWRCEFDLSLIEKSTRLAVATELNELLALGLHTLGKTKAHVECKVIAPTARPTAPAPEKNVVLVLQTPALIACPEIIRNRGMAKACKEAFNQLSGNTGLGDKLTSRFATQSWRGGHYLWYRFQSGKPYRPWLLFDAGSTFVFENLSEDQRNLLTSWMRTGLPMPDWVEKHFKIKGKAPWQWCPYIRENGFGEIALNPTLPDELGRPPQTPPSSPPPQSTPTPEDPAT